MNLPKGITTVIWKNIDEEVAQLRYYVRKMIKGRKYNKLFNTLKEAKDYLEYIKNPLNTVEYNPIIIENLKLKESIEYLEKINQTSKIPKKNTSVFNNKDKLIELSKISNSLSDILKAFDIKKTGKTVNILRKYLIQFNIDTSHFNQLIIKNSSKSNEEIFIENSPVDTQVVKKRIIKENLISYICSGKNCGNKGIWHGVKLTLQLDHKNGNNRDHRLENLCFLCPNCHSITSTWGNKKRNKIM